MIVFQWTGRFQDNLEPPQSEEKGPALTRVFKTWKAGSLISRADDAVRLLGSSWKILIFLFFLKAEAETPFSFVRLRFYFCFVWFLIYYLFYYSSQHFWHQMCGYFSHAHQFSCLTIQLNSDSLNLELPSDPRGSGLVPQDCPHVRCPLQVQASHTSSQPAINQGLPWPPPGVWWFARMCHRTKGNTSMYWFIVKDMTKDANRWVKRSGSVLRIEASVPVELGYTILLAHGCVHQPKSCLNPVVDAFVWRHRGSERASSKCAILVCELFWARDK